MAQLRSPDWWDQIIALRFFERKGSEADIKRMKKLKSSATLVKGKNWKEGDTVGSVAVEAMAGLRERLKHASGTEVTKKSTK